MTGNAGTDIGGTADRALTSADEVWLIAQGEVEWHVHGVFVGTADQAAEYVADLNATLADVDPDDEELPFYAGDDFWCERKPVLRTVADVTALGAAQ
jgi:hypothetical protein